MKQSSTFTSYWKSVWQNVLYSEFTRELDLQIAFDTVVLQLSKLSTKTLLVLHKNTYAERMSFKYDSLSKMICVKFVYGPDWKIF